MSPRAILDTRRRARHRGAFGSAALHIRHVGARATLSLTQSDPNPTLSRAATSQRIDTRLVVGRRLSNRSASPWRALGIHWGRERRTTVQVAYDFDNYLPYWYSAVRIAVDEGVSRQLQIRGMRLINVA